MREYFRVTLEGLTPQTGTLINWSALYVCEEAAAEAIQLLSTKA